MIRGKSGRVVFIFLLVIIVAIAIVTLYIGFRKVMDRHEGYLTGEIVKTTLADFHNGEMWLNYIDYAAKYSAANAIINLSYFSMERCKTIAGIPLIMPGCIPTKEQLSTGFYEKFNRRFSKYIAQDYLATFLKMPAMLFPEYFYSLEGGKLYGNTGSMLVISDTPAVKYQVTPSFAIQLPLDAVGFMADVFQRAKLIQESCADSDDYRQCITNGVVAQGTNWNIELPNAGEALARFAEEYVACSKSPDTNCYCGMDQGNLQAIYDENNKMAFGIYFAGGLVFTKVKHPSSTPPLETIKTGESSIACYFPDGNIHLVTEMRVNGAAGYLRIFAYDSGWEQIDTSPPPILIKFPFSGNEFVCMLTTTLDKAAALMGVSEVLPCSIPETLYARVNSIKILTFDEKTGSVKVVPFEMRLAFREE